MLQQGMSGDSSPGHPVIRIDAQLIDFFAISRDVAVNAFIFVGQFRCIFSNL